MTHMFRYAQDQTFTTNLNSAVEKSIVTSCNCSITLTLQNLVCYDNISILFVGSVPSNEIQYMFNWINQSSYLIINNLNLSVDKSFCKYQISSLSATGCSSVRSSPSIANTFEFKVGVAGGGAAMILCCYNVVLIALKLARQRKEKYVCQ